MRVKLTLTVTTLLTLVLLTGCGDAPNSGTTSGTGSKETPNPTAISTRKLADYARLTKKEFARAFYTAYFAKDYDTASLLLADDMSVKSPVVFKLEDEENNQKNGRIIEWKIEDSERYPDEIKVSILRDHLAVGIKYPAENYWSIAQYKLKATEQGWRMGAFGWG